MMHDVASAVKRRLDVAVRLPRNVDVAASEA